jgi:hypothetical protein
MTTINEAEDKRAWQQQGKELVRNADRSQWDLGDWMVKGEDKFRVTYKQAAALIGGAVAADTLRQFAYVARNVSTRVDGLSFGHHRLVAPLSPEDQQLLLTAAAKHHLSVHDLRKDIAWRRESIDPKTGKMKTAEEAAVRGALLAIAACRKFRPWELIGATVTRGMDQKEHRKEHRKANARIHARQNRACSFIAAHAEDVLSEKLRKDLLNAFWGTVCDLRAITLHLAGEWGFENVVRAVSEAVEKDEELARRPHKAQLLMNLKTSAKAAAASD